MSYIKHSERTVRKGCKTCGRSDLYWGHDTSRDSHLRCGKCSSATGGNAGGKWVMIEKDGTLHGCFAAAGNEQTPDSPVTDSPAPAEVKPASTGFGGVSPNASQAADLLAQLMTLMGPKLDMAEIHAIIDAKLAGIIVPTMIEVKHPDGHVSVPSGATHKIMPNVLKLVSRRQHVLMVGPAGTGKSKIAQQVSEALELPYSEISLSPDRATSALLGYMNATGQYIATEFRKRFEHGGVMHFDEMDNAHPSVLAVINAGLANGHMAFPDGMVKRHADFVCVASANTYGLGPDRAYVGRQAIDKATLNRFLVVPVGYDETLERMICLGSGLAESKVDKVLTWIRALRANIMQHKIPAVCGTRNAMHLCVAIDTGIKLADAIEYAVRCGMSDQDWNRVTNGVTQLAV